jgi:hypothetical protein
MFILLFTYIIKTCKTPISKPSLTEIETIHDTFYTKKDTVFQDIPFIRYKDTGSIKTFLDTFVFIDSSCDFYKSQLVKLAKLYSTKNIYNDTILIDTFGYVNIVDTVLFNNLQNRTYHLNYAFTTKIVNNKNPFWYAGGSVYTNKKQAGLNATFGYVSSKRNMYNANVLMLNNNVYYGLGFNKAIR